MKAKIIRIGNSLGIILPSGVLEVVGAKAGDSIELEPKGGRITLILGKKKTKK